MTPDSPKDVVANEVYPYPPRFNQRTWRERCKAGRRFELVTRVYQAAARSKAFSEIFDDWIAESC
jgi:hypothetical protein